MANFRLTLSYDGTRYRGWQRQGNTDCTIQAKVETVLGRILDQPVAVSYTHLAGSSRRNRECSDYTYAAPFSTAAARHF